ncbi:spindle assembly checkpoint component Mad1 [Lasiosphaeria miniovina]|uniref:Spindle assembly checkpoint component MAD1 n=1 Tax=Lasiosphaeria miniovina TaxID=1954250 RepID=A0AA40DI15_9PEZI|nr:spindle assembly checkpoint component Mad1 [Lasiosphaeria miniovina]KAK0702081.1 spindle assembly checkpoint component Mad1 [Lasiosphaeria miniovina]
MRPFTPQQGDRSGDARRRNSVNSNSQFRTSVGSGLPRPNTNLRDSRFGESRGISTQAPYNIFTGEANPAAGSMVRSTSRQGNPSGPSPPRGRPRAATTASNFSRESSKENLAPADAEEYEAQRRRIEELKAEAGTLRYQISNYEQEKELARLQTENELRDAKRRAEDDFKAKQAAEAEKTKALRQLEALQEELDTERAEKESQKRALEVKTRDALEEARLLQERLEDLGAAKDEAARIAEREATDLKARLAASQRAARELEQESTTREDVLEKTQALLAERDETVGRLEADVLRLKAQTGDAETIAVIRRELTEQVAHIRMLEAKNRDQLGELKHLRQVHKAVEIVEEEKRSLQRRLEANESVHAELAEERRQRQRLEDERQAWAAYLQREASASDQSFEFDSPEAVARALVSERLNSASLLDRLGAMQPEITDRDNIIRSLENERAGLQSQIEKLKTATVPGAVDKARARFDRQRALALKEVEYLRAQLSTFDMEDITLQPERVDQEQAKRVKDLEDLVEKYKQEVEVLHADLSALESASATEQPRSSALLGTKRSHEESSGRDLEAESEQLGQLSRKNRKLQSEFTELQNAHFLLQKEQKVTAEQLAAAKEQLKTRVLSLRSNPTSDLEAVKTATLRALKRENAELLAQMEGQPTLFATVPTSQLAAVRREIAEAQAETASAQKAAARLKQVWSDKSAEFKEAVFSTLGWTVSFIPGGKMRVESVYYPSQTDEHENSIVFDGEKGTMKVGGGPRSAFANRIGDNIKFWVRERGCVPCFLAALTLEFYDEHTRAVRSS